MSDFDHDLTPIWSPATAALIADAWTAWRHGTDREPIRQDYRYNPAVRTLLAQITTAPHTTGAMTMTIRGRPARQRQRILDRAAEMHSGDGRVNKSRIARELHVHISTVFRALPRISI